MKKHMCEYLSLPHYKLLFDYFIIFIGKFADALLLIMKDFSF